MTSPDEILAALAARGYRRTGSRRAIAEAIVAAGSHFTADDLGARLPRVDRSTVYRTLDTLEEAGIVDHVHLGHGRAVYHLAHEDHHHLVCESCETVIELPLEKLRSLAGAVDREYGFELDRRHFALVGRCGSCRVTGGGPRAGRTRTAAPDGGRRGARGRS
ncbi:MAG TPA: Fur family transcriptional regulator [Actinomycetota bacterium]|nr:Fur family transcriptional regulator [Actinomycetota bacterium]